VGPLQGALYTLFCRVVCAYAAAGRWRMQIVFCQSWRRSPAAQRDQCAYAARLQGMYRLIIVSPNAIPDHSHDDQLECNGAEFSNVSASGSAAAGTINVCSFDLSLSLTAGVTGNFFEGNGSPSPWTGGGVEVQIVNRSSATAKRSIHGAVRLDGCMLMLKADKLDPPIILSKSLLQSGWKDTGISKSLLFTSNDGSQTVKILDKSGDEKDDTWPFFCQVALFCSRLHELTIIRNHVLRTLPVLGRVRKMELCCNTLQPCQWYMI
jgi:hypothetical protein